jgi:hypothetical protein
MADYMTIQESTLPIASDADVTHIRVIATNDSDLIPKDDLHLDGSQIDVSVEGITATDVESAIAELKALIDDL